MSGRPSDLQARLHYASNRFGMGKNVVGIESLLDEAAETIAALEADRLAALAPVNLAMDECVALFLRSVAQYAGRDIPPSDAAYIAAKASALVAATGVGK